MAEKLMKCLVFVCYLTKVLSEFPETFSPNNWWNDFDPEIEPFYKDVEMIDSLKERQKFLLNVIIQVHKPLLNEELTTMGSDFIDDLNFYKDPENWVLQIFLGKCRNKTLLKNDEIFNIFNYEHALQLDGLVKFLSLPWTWKHFQKNVCYARLNMNFLVFVFGLQKALEERLDAKDLIMPSLNEILPHLFYDRDIIWEATNVPWEDLAGEDSLYKSKRSKFLDSLQRKKNYWTIYFDKLKSIFHSINQDDKRNDLLKSEEIKETKNLSEIVVKVYKDDFIDHLRDDFGLNNFWNHVVNQRLLNFIKNQNDSGTKERDLEDYRQRLFERFEGAVKTRSLPSRIIKRDLMSKVKLRALSSSEWIAVELIKETKNQEVFIFNLQQILARLSAENIVNSLQPNQNIFYPHLLTTGGISYSLPALKENEFQKILDSILKILEKDLEYNIHKENKFLSNDSIVWNEIDQFLNSCPETGNIWDGYLAFLKKKLYNVSEKNKPTYLSIGTGQLREHFFQLVTGSLLSTIELLSKKYNNKPYTIDYLSFDRSITINELDMDRLITFTELFDNDLINLIDQQILQSKSNNIGAIKARLVARQKRLNHQPFNLKMEITTSKEQKVSIRIFLIPFKSKYPILLDAFPQDLKLGVNIFTRYFHDAKWVSPDSSSLSEIYKIINSNNSSEQDFDDLISSNCKFPRRLLLPRGIVGGLKMNLLVIATPQTEDDLLVQKYLNEEHMCGFEAITYGLDALPLSFPFDQFNKNLDIMDLKQLPNVNVMEILVEHSAVLRTNGKKT